MKKLLFTIIAGIVAFGTSQATELPYMKLQRKSTLHEKMDAHSKKVFPFIQLSPSHRVSNVNPDSVTVYEGTSSGWSMMYTGGFTYDMNGRPTRLVLYMQGIPLPLGSIDVTYNATGKVTSIQQDMLLPTPSTMFRLEQRFDANQNLTSIRYFESMGSGLQLSYGDSVLYTYSGTTITAAERSYYDDFFASAWVKSDRLSGLSFNANNELTAITFQSWDDLSATWSTEMLKYANLQWDLGYIGLDALIGLQPLTLNDFFSVMPTLGNTFVLQAPTNYIEWAVDGSVVDTLSRSSSVMTGGRVSQILTEMHVAAGVWLPSYRTNYVYNSSNAIVTATEQGFDGQGWSDEYRYEWGFDAQNNLTKEEEWYFNGIALELGYGVQYEYLYTATNIPFQVITKYWDGMSYEDAEKNVYNFGSFNTSASNLSHADLKVYPNPVFDALNIRVNATHVGSMTLEVYNVAGQRVANQQFELNNGTNQLQLSTQHWQAGVYLVKIQSAAGIDVVRIVK